MPVFTTAAATLRARRAARNPSLVSPLSTAPAPAHATAQPETNGPTSPQLESESIVLKAKRAYDRDRQRVKKRKERADREREWNASSHSDPSADQGPTGRRTGGKPKLVSDAVDEKGGERDVFPNSPGVEEIIADIVEREAQARGVVEPVRVPLDQLVKPSKVRKSRAGEFELVPGMPVVIALDDQIPGEAELDEPWEHISADELDEKRVEPPSYATVLANAL
ncbi:hypothetical protein C8T65DRAFT_645829 [Cerioporus squamosus]|nr:hypothetical protein C8T65DRAFT_645829 [Cerioporus squamosus]